MRGFSFGGGGKEEDCKRKKTGKAGEEFLLLKRKVTLSRETAGKGQGVIKIASEKTGRREAKSKGKDTNTAR